MTDYLDILKGATEDFHQRAARNFSQKLQTFKEKNASGDPLKKEHLPELISILRDALKGGSECVTEYAQFIFQEISEDPQVELLKPLAGALAQMPGKKPWQNILASMIHLICTENADLFMDIWAYHSIWHRSESCAAFDAVEKRNLQGVMGNFWTQANIPFMIRQNALILFYSLGYFYEVPPPLTADNSSLWEDISRYVQYTPAENSENFSSYFANVCANGLVEAFREGSSALEGFCASWKNTQIIQDEKLVIPSILLYISPEYYAYINEVLAQKLAETIDLTEFNSLCDIYTRYGGEVPAGQTVQMAPELTKEKPTQIFGLPTPPPPAATP